MDRHAPTADSSARTAWLDLEYTASEYYPRNSTPSNHDNSCFRPPEVAPKKVTPAKVRSTKGGANEKVGKDQMRNQTNNILHKLAHISTDPHKMSRLAEPTSRPKQAFPMSSGTAKMRNTVFYTEFSNVRPVHGSGHSAEDLLYLENTGCWYLPCRSLLDEFVQEYFRYVQPVLPVVDGQRFWDHYFGNSIIDSGLRGLSLLLIQCMLCEAVQHVSPWVLHELGLRSVHAARETFYRRAKTLFALEVEADSYTKSQSALLLSCTTAMMDPTTAANWLSISIQYAQTLSAPSWYAFHAGDTAYQLAPKRLWWCLLLRDRTLSITSHRPLQISPFLFDIDISLFTSTDIHEDFGAPESFNWSVGLGAAALFECQRGLIHTLTDLSLLLFAPRMTGGLMADFTRDPGVLDPWDNLSSRLLEWKAQLKVQETCFCDPQSIFLISSMRIYYSTAVVTLETQRVLRMAGLINATFDTRQHSPRSAEIVSAAITNIAAVIRRMLVKDLVRHLPATMCVLLPLVFHELAPNPRTCPHLTLTNGRLPALVTPLLFSGLDVLLCSTGDDSAACKQQFCYLSRAMALFERHNHRGPAGSKDLCTIIYEAFDELATAVEMISGPNAQVIMHPGSLFCEGNLLQRDKALAVQCGEQTAHPQTTAQSPANWNELVQRNPRFYTQLLNMIHTVITTASCPKGQFSAALRSPSSDESGPGSRPCAVGDWSPVSITVPNSPLLTPDSPSDQQLVESIMKESELVPLCPPDNFDLCGMRWEDLPSDNAFPSTT
ncbi:hypothetical protein BJY01DRAFT_249268 [Aspergillus pseudoustus]|uniref:Xylanolytic transcriptional activator regulatory domain-containing protein n=1 Tax=Aspergillus pseudoustus TaxID=1810923 RepID=A0ABR4JPR8_9EURO